MASVVPDRLAALARRLLPWFAGAFAAGTLLQVYQAGQVTLGSGTWASHVAVGHGLSTLAVGVVVLAYVGGVAPRVRRLAWLVLGAYYATVGLAVFRFTDAFGVLATFHPVAAALAFLAGVLLAAVAADPETHLPGLGYLGPAGEDA